MARRLSNIRHCARDESGVVLVLTAILLTVLLGCAALAIDLGSFYHAQRQAQSAADAGALAAAQDLSGTSSTSAANDGTTIATTNYPGSSVTVSQPQSNQAKVVVKASTPSFFGRLLGVSKANVSASAVAQVTGTPQQCTSSSNTCYVIFAMDASCTGDPVNLGGGGYTINGAVWSNGSINVADGGSTFGPTYYGNGSGCTVAPAKWQQQNNQFAAGPTAEPPLKTWPIDYSVDFPECGTADGPPCTGPCTVSTTPCPAADRTPSYCTQATNASSETLVSYNPGTLTSGNVYCDVGSGNAHWPADPNHPWDGAITANQTGKTPIAATYVAGSVSIGGGSELEPCGYSASGYQASSCSSSIPTPKTPNYPLMYAVGTGTPINYPGGGGALWGDMFAPNGTIYFGAGGETITFAEALDVQFIGGGLTGDGPPATSVGPAANNTVSLVQ